MARQPVTQNFDLERAALADSLKSGAQGGANNGAFAAGSDVNARLQADPALRQLTQEGVYMRAYGTGNPQFASPGQQQYQKEMRQIQAARDAGQFDPNAYRGFLERSQGGIQTPLINRTMPGGGLPQTQYSELARPSLNIQPQQRPPLDVRGLMGSIDRYNTPQTPMSDEEMYQQELTRQQSQIDAINARYAGLIDAARDQGGATKNRARAVANAGGGLYSPRTEASYSTIDDSTNQAVAQLEQARGTELAAVNGLASGNALQRFLAGSALATQQGNNYVNNTLQLFNALQAEKVADSNRYLAEAGLTGMLGGTPTLDFLNYQRGLQNDQFSNYLGQSNLDLQRQQMMQNDYQFVELPDGTYGYFDPRGGTFSSLGRSAIYSGGYGSDGRYSSGGGVAPGGRSLTDYWETYDKYPSDAGDIETVDNLWGNLYGRYATEELNGGAGPVVPPGKAPNLFDYYRGRQASSGTSELLEGIEDYDYDNDGQPG